MTFFYTPNHMIGGVIDEESKENSNFIESMRGINMSDAFPAKQRAIISPDFSNELQPTLHSATLSVFASIPSITNISSLSSNATTNNIAVAASSSSSSSVSTSRYSIQTYMKRPPGDRKATNLMVNYLPDNVYDGELYQLFSRVGEIAHCRVIKNTHYKSECYGFVDFVRAEDAERAIEQFHQFELGTKRLKVQNAYEGLLIKEEQKNREMSGRLNSGWVVRISNAPFFLRLTQLKELAGKYGEILHIVQSCPVVSEVATTTTPHNMVFDVIFKHQIVAIKAQSKVNGLVVEFASEPLCAQLVGYIDDFTRLDVTRGGGGDGKTKLEFVEKPQQDQQLHHHQQFQKIAQQQLLQKFVNGTPMLLANEMFGWRWDSPIKIWIKLESVQPCGSVVLRKAAAICDWVASPHRLNNTAASAVLVLLDTWQLALSLAYFWRNFCSKQSNENQLFIVLITQSSTVEEKTRGDAEISSLIGSTHFYSCERAHQAEAFCEDLRHRFRPPSHTLQTVDCLGDSAFVIVGDGSSGVNGDDAMMANQLEMSSWSGLAREILQQLKGAQPNFVVTDFSDRGRLLTHLNKAFSSITGYKGGDSGTALTQFAVANLSSSLSEQSFNSWLHNHANLMMMPLLWRSYLREECELAMLEMLEHHGVLVSLESAALLYLVHEMREEFISRQQQQKCDVFNVVIVLNGGGGVDRGGGIKLGSSTSKHRTNLSNIVAMFNRRTRGFFLEDLQKVENCHDNKLLIADQQHHQCLESSAFLNEMMFENDFKASWNTTDENDALFLLNGNNHCHHYDYEESNAKTGVENSEQKLDGKKGEEEHELNQQDFVIASTIAAALPVNDRQPESLISSLSANSSNEQSN